MLHMSTHPVPELLQRWAKGELTSEQAIGHLLQHLLGLSQRLSEVEKRLRQHDEPPAKPHA
jgi:hypothetical protein